MTDTTVIRRPTGLSFRRRYRQAPERLFAAFADPDTLARWWGPPECPIVESALDFRPGGEWLYRLRSAASGVEYRSRAVFDEIEPATRIVFTETSADASGAPTADRPAARTTVEFVADGDDDGPGTLLLIDVEHVSEDEAARALARGVEGGMSRALDQLEALLATARTREGRPDGAPR
ncbi:SRPBCC domain-containing protein [Agromyces protaetiae]|uniref:SRPBCC domain-containing protein n=1 Tax=Agromyces protaetiae TaxID=2509455 RepID=A0A4P6FCF6_9MICO|nr:SRPBCC domain-containing protein [Agromyces protaetiae]QAY73732.1 SRPBCC domain-containing protein [Agromyces protaetiae]